MKSENILVFDVETSTISKGHPFDPRNRLVSYACVSNGDITFKYYTDPDFIPFLKGAVERADCLVGFNIKFDTHWLANVGIKLQTNHKVWDCQLAEFIYTGQEHRFASLNDTCKEYGLPVKTDLVAEYWNQGVSTENIPLSILKEYNCWDVQLTKMLFDVQQRMLSEKQKRLVWLEGEDLKTLQAAEWAGVKFDTAKADEKVTKYTSDINGIERLLNDYLPDGIPEGAFNYDSGDHLSALLYGGEIQFKWATESPAVYKTGEKAGQSYIQRRWFTTAIPFDQRFKPLEGTEVKKTAEDPSATTRFYQTDAPTLKQLKSRKKENGVLLELLAERSGKIKVVEMVESIRGKIKNMNWQDDLIHPQYNQNVVITGRLSSSAPNMQNTPVEVDELLVSRYAD